MSRREVVKILLERNDTNPNIADIFRFGAMPECAVKNGYQRIAKLFQRRADLVPRDKATLRSTEFLTPLSHPNPLPKMPPRFWYREVIPNDYPSTLFTSFILPTREQILRNKLPSPPPTALYMLIHESLQIPNFWISLLEPLVIPLPPPPIRLISFRRSCTDSSFS